jgi:sugar transferase (PEP-CTERM/EpsH1 system associated)
MSSRHTALSIVHIVETLEIGGAEHVVVALASRQLQDGHDVSIACLFREGPLAHKARSLGITVMDCRKRPGLDVLAVIRLRQWLRARRVQVLHSHNAVAHYYGIFASRRLNVETVINTQHGMAENLAHRRLEWLFKRSMPFTHHAVSVCDAARRQFIRRGIIPKNKAVTVVNGIDLSNARPANAKAKADLLSSLGLAPESLVFGTVGRLNPIKDQISLIRAFAGLQGNLDANRTHAPAASESVLILVGDGPAREALIAEIEQLKLTQRVRLLGSRDDVPKILASFDVFVLSSLSEGYSLALVEAASAGLPIIATDVGGNAEIVHEGLSGLIVPAGDLEALMTAMRRLLKDPQLRQSMGKEAARWADQHGSIDTMHHRYLDLYRNPCARFVTDQAPSGTGSGNPGSQQVQAPR